MNDVHRRRVAWLVACCFFMENLDVTIVTTTAPRLRAALHVSSTAIGLLISSYLITFAVVIPLGGWLVAKLGERRLFLGAIAIFTSASLLCALSSTLGELVAARTLQGVGAALMVPVGRMVVLANADKTDIMRLIGYVVWPGLFAPVVGPLVGGIIISLGSWRWLFLPNVPLGIIAFIVGLVLMRSSTSPPPARQQLDWLGMLLTCGGLGGLVYAVFIAGEIESSWNTVVLILGGSLLLVVLSGWHLLRDQNPFLDLRVMRTRSLGQSLVGVALFTIAVGAVPLLLPLMFQDLFGWSPIKSGILVMFVFVGNIAAKPSTSHLLNRFGHRRVLITTNFGVTSTMLAFSLVGVATPLIVIAAIALVNGVARSIGFSAFMTMGFADVPELDMSAANTLSAMVQQLFAGFAISAGVVLLRIGGRISRAAATHPGAPDSYRVAFGILALIALVTALGSFKLDPDSGHALRRPLRGTDR